MTPTKLRSLAEEYGTPLLVIDGPTVEREVARYLDAVRRSAGGRLFYASKALTLVPLVGRIASRGAGIEVVSPGELATALAAGVPAGRILLNGSPKAAQDIDVAVRAGVTTFVLDAREELGRLEASLAAHGRTAKVLIRYTPERPSDTHHYVQTAGEASKFGFLRSEALAMAGRLAASGRVRYLGLHVHIGSNLSATDEHLEAAVDAAGLIEEISGAYGLMAEVLDIGGGFATATPARAPAVADLVGEIDAHLLMRFGETRPAVWLEPGRALVEGAGTLVYEVLAVKSRPKGPLILVDGGMGDNIRPALYGARYALGVEPRREGELRPHEVYGRYCESGDRIGDLMAADVRAGDLLLVERAGAYTYSMASNYNRIGRPAVVWDGPSGATVMARREHPDELLRLDGEALPEASFGAGAAGNPKGVVTGG